MASVRTNTGRNGGTSYTVQWRDGSGKQGSKTVKSKRVAAKIKKQADFWACSPQTQNGDHELIVGPLLTSRG